mmetsp:Transcript_31286/g.73448  ORF Transcript_31286/g.73448 Transcript_31286/m.73448 type:complete len:293 (+) Transcript_31286:206-1084(+)
MRNRTFVLLQHDDHDMPNAIADGSANTVTLAHTHALAHALAHSTVAATTVAATSTTGTCTDTDGGVDISVQGTVMDNIGNVRTDYCDFGQVVEHYCQVDGSYSKNNYDCPSGEVCSDGACVVCVGLLNLATERIFAGQPGVTLRLKPSSQKPLCMAAAASVVADGVEEIVIVDGVELKIVHPTHECRHCGQYLPIVAWCDSSQTKIIARDLKKSKAKEAPAAVVPKSPTSRTSTASASRPTIRCSKSKATRAKCVATRLRPQRSSHGPQPQKGQRSCRGLWSALQSMQPLLG